MTSTNRSLNLRIQPIHLSIVKDRSLLGQNVDDITDTALLTDWLKECEWLNSNDSIDYKTRQLREFAAAGWVRLNLLHPKVLLKFEDLNENVHQA